MTLKGCRTLACWLRTWKELKGTVGELGGNSGPCRVPGARRSPGEGNILPALEVSGKMGTEHYPWTLATKRSPVVHRGFLKPVMEERGNEWRSK